MSRNKNRFNTVPPAGTTSTAPSGANSGTNPNPSGGVNFAGPNAGAGGNFDPMEECKKLLDSTQEECKKLKTDLKTEFEEKLAEQKKGLEEKIAEQNKEIENLKEKNNALETKFDAVKDEFVKYKEKAEQAMESLDSEYRKAHPEPKDWAYFFYTKVKGATRFSLNPKNPDNDKIIAEVIGSREPEALKAHLFSTAERDEPGLPHPILSDAAWIDPVSNEAIRILTDDEKITRGIK